MGLRSFIVFSLAFHSPSFVIIDKIIIDNDLPFQFREIF